MSIQIRLISAQLSHDTQTFSNMDPYCLLQLGSQRKRSRTKNQAGKKPVWNQTFRFTSTDNNLTITVMDEDVVTDDLVGQGQLNVSKYRYNSNQQQEIVQLFYQGKAAGKVMLSIGGGNMGGNIAGTQGNTWGNQNNNNFGGQQIGGQQFGNQGYNQPVPNNNQWGGQTYQQGGYQQGGNQQGGYQQQNQWNSQGNIGGGQWGQNPQNQGYSGPNSQGNIPSQWGNLNTNNGWGNFNPSSTNPNSGNLYPQINNSQQPPINPFNLVSGILGPNQVSPPPPPPPQNNQPIPYQFVNGMSGLINQQANKNPYSAGNPYI